MAFAFISNLCVLKTQQHKKSREKVEGMADEVLDAVKASEQNLQVFMSALIDRLG